ncbi:hypothetical protein SAMN05444359_104127 [Neolewinella agarilytica]|uniref:Curli production assembly/transport component CsgG n=2 Tax=Neolewinella agarilytica TaxID=478744 RepID=A0A1H9CB75_9BACT|nr:hypothetical protein SAMN05444359_104127 [Neolewinella agarilytica]
MLTTIIRLGGALLCLFFTQTLHAQRVNVSVEPIEHFDPYFEDLAEEIEDFVSRQLTKNKALRLVERANFAGIIDEQERQKNEGFIDGEVVEQGKMAGASLLVRFKYNELDADLRLQVVDITNGEILCTSNYPTKTNSDNDLPLVVWGELTANLESCFKQYKAPASAPLQVIELLPSDGRKAHLLVYSKDTRSVKPGTRLSIYTITKKRVGDQEVDYPTVIGELVVKEIENKNFLNGEVLKGSDAIRLQLKEESEIYAKLFE